MILNSPYISGSLTVTGNITACGGITISGSVASASYASNTSFLNGSGSGEFVPTGSFNTFSSSILSYTGSANSRLGSLETTSGSNITRIDALETASGSAITRLSSLESKTGSYATTGSNTFVGGQYLSSSFNPTGFTTTASLYTDGGLRVTKDAYISGTLYLNNVTVYGTQSVCYITSSQLNIASNLISVNTATPSVRFGGLAVYDSGSTGLTGSILWDSENNRWIYSNPSGSTYDGGMFISGPRNSSGLGSETGTTACALMKGQGGDHITSSGVFEIGGSVGVGTSNICSNLHVNSSGSYIWSAGNGYGDFYIGNGTYGLSMGTAIGGGGAGDTRLWTKGGTHTFYIGTSNVDALKIDSSQNICVAGNIYGCSSILANNNIRVSTATSAGNATDPAITTGGCTKVGIYFAGGCVGFGASGNMLILTSTGKVGIGTQTPDYGNLSIFCVDNTVLSSTVWGTSTANGVVATVYNGSQCANSIAGLRLITRNSGASIWNIYNVSVGSGAGDLAFGNGQGGSGTEKLRITETGITCFACRVCAPQFLATFNADGDNTAIFINSASTYTYGPGGVFIGSSTANNCTNLAAGNGALIIRNGSSTYTAAIAYNGQAYFCNCVGIGTPSPIAQLQICSSDGQLRLSGDGRAQMILGTSAKAWQFETSCGAGNVAACSIGIVEAGAGTRFQIYAGGIASFACQICLKEALYVCGTFPRLVLDRSATSAQSDIKFVDAGSSVWSIGTAVQAVGSNLDFYNYSLGGNVLKLTTTGEACFKYRPQFPGASLICSYTCSYSSYTAGCWLGLFAGDLGFNGAYAFTVVGQFNLGGSGLYSMNYASVPYIHKSDSIGSTNGNDFYWLQHNSSGHADNGALVCFRRVRYSGNTPAGNRTEFCMNVSYSNSFTATTYVLAWV